MMTLDKGKRGKTYQIVGFCGDDRILKRFLELGFMVGGCVKIVATSLLKKAFLIEVRGILLSVRATLLGRVQVQ